MYANAVPISDRYAYPMMFVEVSVSGSPSATSTTGTSSNPPAVSCHPVAVSSETPGRPQRFVRTRPNAIEAVPASPAKTPIGSSLAVAVSTASATPTAPIKPATRVRKDTRSASNSTPRPATIRG
ncbi:hypothetical protein FB565_002464 [Actinoplanes lutulentus]|nr:hypothetical protein [Actinoplanes lutulentus]